MSAHPSACSGNKSPAPGISPRTGDLLVPLGGWLGREVHPLPDRLRNVRNQVRCVLTKQRIGMAVGIARHLSRPGRSTDRVNPTALTPSGQGGLNDGETLSCRHVFTCLDRTRVEEGFEGQVSVRLTRLFFNV